MRYETFLRNHTETVVLGLPASPARCLQRLCRLNGSRPFLLAPQQPFPLLLIPFARVLRCPPRFSDILLMTLADLALRNEGKRITLIPATDEATDFVREHCDSLESLFVIEWTLPHEGGIKA